MVDDRSDSGPCKWGSCRYQSMLAVKRPCPDPQGEPGRDAFTRTDRAGAVIDHPDMNGSRRIAGPHGVSILAAISDAIVAITGGTSAQSLENR